jgi:6,7-dimethyl-8-ribityllumazine synthase
MEPRVIEGNLVATDLRIGIIAARWNAFMGEKLIEAAVDTIVRHGGSKDNVTIVRVPGSFEIPLACKKLIASGPYDAVINLGVLIRGATSHYDLICSQVSKGISDVGLQTGVPCTFGVITADTIEQAIERSGSKAGNKGVEAATAAIEMAQLSKELRER